MNRRLLPTLLATLTLTGCSAPMGGTVPVGDVTLTVQPEPRVDGTRFVASQGGYVAADIHHVIVQLYTLDGQTETAVSRGSGPVQARVEAAALGGQLTFSNLHYGTAYRIRGYAYDASNTLISLDASSSVDVPAITSANPAIANLPIQLKGVALPSSSATSSLAVVDGTYSYSGNTSMAAGTN